MSAGEVDTALNDLPLDSKIGALIVNLCERDMDAITALTGLIGTVAIVGKNLRRDVDRRRCAMILRECATEVEAEYRPL